MASLTMLHHLAIAALMTYLVYGAVNQVALPTIDLNECWGPYDNATAKTCTNSTTISNFTIDFNETMIEDLIYRLNSSRTFAAPLEGVGFQYGFNSTALKPWITYMMEEYPYAERQTYLNQYSQYKTIIQGLDIHFIRVQTENITSYTNIVRLMLIHSWPGSVREFYDTIPYLLSQSLAQGFGIDIIIPSLPGFGFSDGAVRPGMGVDKVAVICRNLMQKLGLSEYYIQAGGDVGSLIASNMATLFPNEVKGYHMNFPLVHTPEILFRLFLGSYYPDEVANSSVIDRIYPLTTKMANLMTATGYLHMQATKPDTLGVGLSDSPAGLMGYTLDKVAVGLRQKFINYTDGGLTEILTAEQIFDNYMIYWSTNCITTAMRLYAETFNKRYIALRMNEIRTPVPTWVLQTPDALLYVPPWMIKMKFTNLLNETLPSEGGDFYAWEKPELFAKDVITAIVAFDKWHTMNSTLYTSCQSYISD